MYKLKLVFKVFQWLTLLSVLAAGISSAQGGISLVREPAPPQAVYNDGTHSITFAWSFAYTTQSDPNYIFQIFDLAGKLIDTRTFSSTPSPISNSTTWLVPSGQESGPYYGKLSFFSNWQTLDSTKPECQARVGFLISPAATIQLHKFCDLNGDGIFDPLNEQSIPDWHFTITRVDTGYKWYLVTDATGLTASQLVTVNPTGKTAFSIEEENRPAWVKTAPAALENGLLPDSTNPIIRELEPGQCFFTRFGNWQPIIIEGYKYLDENPNPLCVDFPDTTVTRLPNTRPIEGINIGLYNDLDQLLETTTTTADGKFSFSPRRYAAKFYIKEEMPHPDVPTFDLPGATPPCCSIHQLTRWPGTYVCRASQSPWQSPPLDLSQPCTITLNLPPPTESKQVYGDNFFYNQLPARIWGVMCQDGICLGNIKVQKDGANWDDAVPLTHCGLYQVPILTVEPEGLRCGTYVLTPPALPDPAKQQWLVTEYCCDNWIFDPHVTTLPSGGSYQLKHDVDSCHDVRVDFCIQTEASRRVCNLPVTFTQEGFKNLSDPDNDIIPGGIIYSRFNLAFPKMEHELVVGTTKKITFRGTSGSLERLCMFLPQTGPSGKLDRSYTDPWDKTSAGALAGETVTLSLNIAYNKAAVMPRTPGYDFDTFILTSGVFKGKTVAEVYVIANAVLGGDPPNRYGLTGYQALTDVIHSINANYEFVDYDTYNDRGYLIKVGEPKKKSPPITVP